MYEVNTLRDPPVKRKLLAWIPAGAADGGFISLSSAGMHTTIRLVLPGDKNPADAPGKVPGSAF